MKPIIIAFSAILFSTFLFCGCTTSRTSDYPDHTPETTRKVDDIKLNARDQKDAIDKKYDEKSNNLDFRERQIREKYKADREAYSIKSGKSNVDRVAKRRNIEVQANFDKDKIDADAAEKLKSSPAEDEAKIKAEAISRKAEVDSNATNSLAPILSDTDADDAKMKQHHLEQDLAETKEMTALEKERTQARDEMRLKMVDVDKWTHEELGKVNKGAENKTNK